MAKLKPYWKAWCGLVILGCLMGFCGCRGDSGPDRSLQIFAGSACQPVLKEIALEYEKRNGVAVAVTFGGSGFVLSQMRLTEQGDVYMPGSSDFMIKAGQAGLVDLQSIRTAAYLLPAINVKPGNPQNILSLADLSRQGIRVGIAKPGHVCVGLYAVELLQANGLLASVLPNIVVTTESCAKAASAIALSDLDAVIGWREFQFWEPSKITSVLITGDEIVPRIGTIPVAVTTFTSSPTHAANFVEFVCSPAGQAIFRKWGYITDEAEVRQLAPDAAIGGQYILPPDWMEGKNL